MRAPLRGNAVFARKVRRHALKQLVIRVCLNAAYSSGTPNASPASIVASNTMCGIIAIAGKEPVAERLISGLKRLEYRGYDSAGVAVIDAEGRLQRRRAPGKLDNLAGAVAADPIDGTCGIAHTRWATHGAPTEANAHPHLAGGVAIVHNGIIENFAELRAEIAAKGRTFATDTDTEVVAHMIDDAIASGLDPVEASSRTIARLEGAFALAIAFDGRDDLLVGARKGSPLVVGVGVGESYLGSDAFALAPYTNRVIYLDEGDWAVITPDKIDVRDASGASVTRPVAVVSASAAVAEKGNYRHFMEKEIHEQPETIGHTLSAYVDAVGLTALPRDDIDFAHLDRLVLVACGTASYAAMTAKYWFERFAHLPVDVDIGSEFRYRAPALVKNSLALAISQSGETADTLAALRECKQQGLRTAALVNVETSTMAREADVVLPTLAGPEIGVASTKAFTCQLVALACIAIAAGRARGSLSRAEEERLVAALLETPRKVSEALKASDAIEKIAHDIAKATDILYIGRGVSYPIALEGALKLKEISYIHAEGYAAGELKHGPIALIDETLPVVVIAPPDAHFEKTLSNMQEVMAREGKALLISSAAGIAAAGDKLWASIETPETDPMLAPIVYSVPVQLLAYYTATRKGTDVDQPRNLAKSVTVE